MKGIRRSLRIGPTQDRGVAPLRGLAPLVLALVLWQLLAPPNLPYFPPPLAWLRSLDTLRLGGRLWPSLFWTLGSFASALALNVLIGSALGILLGRSPRLDRALGPILEFGRTMPAGALVPVAVLIMGYTESMTLFVVTATSFWPILLNARSGAKRISKDRIETARMLRLSWWATQRKIVLPSVLPDIQLGTQIAAPIILIIVLLVEILTQAFGLGREITLAQSSFRSATVYGLVTLTGLLGLLLNSVIALLGHILRRYAVTTAEGAPG